MPYIKKTDREKFRAVQFPFKLQRDLNELTAGEVNYLITWILNRQLQGANYARYNSMIGALECCKLEIYRRMIAPYENKKCDENGDVFE